ncbi:MAG: hypothetical protein JXX29_23050 [Deltaproteobacteria bacterium]|nr:hypothetical protein [Deltaproteobacteria bacterium]MBN2674578.1 hypothetical protein [Deltaproteobacteria bacterium]
MRWLSILLLFVSLMFLGGCVARNASVATGQKAYVVKGNMFGTKMYHCDASSGTPICTAVAERPLEGGQQ